MKREKQILSPKSSPTKRGAGARVGVGMLRGGGDSLIEKFQSCLVACLISRFLGFLVPWFLGFLLSWFRRFLASSFPSFKNIE